MTLKEIDKQIQELKIQRNEIEKQEREEFKKKAVDNIGRCFIINGTQYVKITGIPKEEYTRTSVHFNQYQYPAFFLDEKEDIPFYEDTLHSNAWMRKNDYFYTYEEITPEEFNAEFDRVVHEFRRKICGI